MKKNQPKCECCGKKVDDNKAPGHDEGFVYCDNCADSMKAICSICGNEDYMWNMTCTSQDEIYCEHCATAIA